MKNIEKIHMDSEKSVNSFEIKKDWLTDYFLNNYFVYHCFNNFSALLLCKINVLFFFDVEDFFKFFSRNTEIQIKSNYWLGMYLTP